MTRSNILIRFMEILGKRWIVPVLLFLFDSGETTFTVLKRHLKITSRALSKKLKLLEALGLVEKIVADNPRKIFYTLSERGKDLSRDILAFSRKFSE